MACIDWHGFELAQLAEMVRETAPGPDAERTIWAFEYALEVAQLDDELLDYVMVAVVCLIARRSGNSPRDVLEAFFRRAIPDAEWRERYLPLF
ncbi:MAG: hypothetical protein ACRDNX_04370 [Gaiellaceae bacterium]